MAAERLQKILARGGIASRRAAEELITSGRVRLNGRIVKELGTKADPFKDRVEVDGKRVVAEQPVYAAIHKPRGVVSTMSDPEGRPTIAELLAPLGARVYPVGRLDFATSGILLATNDGDFANGLLHPKKNVPKTYVLKVQGEMKPEDLDHWRNGIELEDGKTLPAQAKMLRHEGGKTWFEITIHEGRNQQIRRMGEASGFPVMRLARTVFAGISSEGLAPGRYRVLTREELVKLKKEFGVPKRVVSQDDEEGAQGRVVRRGQEDRIQPRAGDRRNERKEPRREDTRGAGRREDTRGAGGGARRDERRGDGRAPRKDDRRDERRTTGRGEGRSQERTNDRGGNRGADRQAPRSNDRRDTRTERFGGGAAGRRPYDREQWGSGSGRGRSGNTDEPREDAPPGRGGRSRTTGTGGGIGAGGGDYRMNRGRRRGE